MHFIYKLCNLQNANEFYHTEISISEENIVSYKMTV